MELGFDLGQCTEAMCGAPIIYCTGTRISYHGYSLKNNQATFYSTNINTHTLSFPVSLFPSRGIYFSSRSLATALIVTGECLRLFCVCLAALRLLYQLLIPWPYHTPTHTHTLLAQRHLYDTWDSDRIHLVLCSGLSPSALSAYHPSFPFVSKHTLLQDHTWLRAHTRTHLTPSVPPPSRTLAYSINCDSEGMIKLLKEDGRILLQWPSYGAKQNTGLVQQHWMCESIVLPMLMPHLCSVSHTIKNTTQQLCSKTHLPYLDCML